jgi:hypothetical protein
MLEKAKEIIAAEVIRRTRGVRWINGRQLELEPMRSGELIGSEEHSVGVCLD